MMVSSHAGRTLAEVSVRAYGGKSESSARAILRDGFESIDRSDLTTPQEKVVARLGQAVGEHNMPDAGAATARLAVMQCIRSGISGPIGPVLATCAIQAHHGLEAIPAATVTRQGLQSIATTPGTSDTDKALAILGYSFGVLSLLPAHADSAQMAALRAIQSPPEGRRPQVLAQTTINAHRTRVEDNWVGSRAITRDGLQAIWDDPESTDQDRALARLGLSFGEHTMDDKHAASARLGALEEIAHPSSTNGVQRLAHASIRAYGAGLSFSSAREITRDGLNAIHGYKHATDLQREIARQGIINGTHGMSDREAATARYSVLQQLNDLAP